ncbi:MAG: hypothetical protein SAK29_41515, partial [Scytonema sp. PMC 1069.18]|nr:hypothetical protein [Scytonema sp. PMC 1069.18]
MLISSSSIQRTKLYEKYKSKIIHNPALHRSLVSFQSSKQTPFSSWFKYREGFSEKLVTYIIQNLNAHSGILLDPFSGGGSALFAASNLGWQTKGIELLPVGIFVTKSRLIAQTINIEEFNKVVHQIR